MKYALITEDQIKTIFQAGVYFSLGEDGKSTTGRHLSDEVFKIVKSLKTREPSMVSSTSNKSFAMYTIEIPFVGEQP